ncbi:hypothetical protein Cni_G28328 [Canna indica]|uniref:Transposase MuDR plant domain-containing protein n=1 Tax=Canna indica TaxID=4628 RepID=A0AAQ3QT14_9LILI|nr:hypothetical protein Cni_G28328 [Canna indica]
MNHFQYRSKLELTVLNLEEESIHPSLLMHLPILKMVVIYEENDDEVITPETSYASLGIAPKRKRRHYKVFNSNCNLQDIRFEIGMQFETSSQFKDAVQSYALHNGVNIRWSRSTKGRMKAKCVKDCPWKIYGSYKQNETAFIVKTYIDEHRCSRSMRNRQTTTEWLVNYYMNTFRRNSNWDVKQMVADFQSKFFIPLPRAKCYRVRLVVLKRLCGSLNDHYALLGPYLAELRKVNSRSTFSIVCDREFTGVPPIFKRLYIGFESLKRGFLDGCRPVIGLDGYFLKIFLGGQLLSTIGTDGNNQMFPIAWAVVEGENFNSWRWFL